MSSDRHDLDRHDLTAAVAAIEAVRVARTAVVAIDGLGGSGKSTLAAQLADLFSAPVVSGDDFYRPMDPAVRAGLSPADGVALYFDWQRLRDQVLAPLRAGRPVSYDRFDWATGDLRTGEPARLNVPTDLVLVEGVYVARPQLSAFYDLTVFVDTPPDEALARIRARGHDHGPEDWPTRWHLAEQRYLIDSDLAGRADLVVRGSRAPA